MFKPSLNRTLAVTALMLLSASVAWSSSVKLLYEFSGRNGRGPSSNLVTDAAGNAYGTVAFGGQSQAGGVYQFSPTSGYHAIYGFSGPDGRQPQGNLVMDTAGNFYGTTIYGGAYKSGCNNQGCGVVFRLSPPKNGGAWTETVLYSFSGGDDGANPQAGVILDSAGNLYGTTEFGGSNGLGTVFEVSPAQGGTWTEIVILSVFEGLSPLGSLVFDDAGNLFGTTGSSGPQGGGTVFGLSPGPGGTWTYTLVYAFDGFNGSQDGDGPGAGLIFDNAGNLCGTTEYGGKYRQGGNFGYGTVFELSPNFDGTWTESILYSFAGGSDGAVPQTALAFDPAGNLYGTTLQGGSGGFSCLGNGCGTVFALVPDGQGGWNKRSFHLPGDGHLGVFPSVPGPPLVKNGRVYVTTNDAANQAQCSGTCGTILQFTP